MQDSKRDTDVLNSLLDSVGKGGAEILLNLRIKSSDFGGMNNRPMTSRNSLVRSLKYTQKLVRNESDIAPLRTNLLFILNTPTTY